MGEAPSTVGDMTTYSVPIRALEESGSTFLPPFMIVRAPDAPAAAEQATRNALKCFECSVNTDDPVELQATHIP